MYVYSNSEGLVLNEVDGGTVMMARGEAWWADDPFVVARPELFSSTPLMVRGTAGQSPPPPTPVVPVAAAAAERRPHTRAKRA
jgi:hypothetical protein